MHLMIDLETLSTSPTAAVTQLGYAFFDPRGDGVARSGVYHLDVSAQMERGLSVDWSTISWWLAQDEEARRKLVSAERHLPSEALTKFDLVYADFRPEGAWSHGATFDIVILANLYRAARRKEPWDFRAARDTRTLFWLAGPELVWAKNETKHSAEADAIAQAITVQRAIRLIADSARRDVLRQQAEGFKNFSPERARKLVEEWNAATGLDLLELLKEEPWTS